MAVASDPLTYRLHQKRMAKSNRKAIFVSPYVNDSNRAANRDSKRPYVRRMEAALP
jgi:hypothetical protein